MLTTIVGMVSRGVVRSQAGHGHKRVVWGRARAVVERGCGRRCMCMSGAVVALGSSVDVRCRATVSAPEVVSMAASVMSEASVPAAYIQVTA